MKPLIQTACERVSHGADDAREATDAPDESLLIASPDDAFRVTIPRKGRLDDGHLFDFARGLRDWQARREPLGPAELDAAADRFWDLSQGRLTGFGSRDQLRLRLREMWERVEVPWGARGLPAALRQARDDLSARRIPPELRRFDDPRILLLALVCRALQLEGAPEPFYLGTRDAAGILGCATRHAAGLLRGLVGAGILQVAQAGKPGGRLATRYRYPAALGSGFPPSPTS